LFEALAVGDHLDFDHLPARNGEAEDDRAPSRSRSPDLQLRVHLLPGLRSGHERRLPELRR
jgi:hypothetical protein